MSLADPILYIITNSNNVMFQLSKALRGEKTEITDLELATLFGAGSQGRELLQSLDFEISDVDATPPGGRSCELHGAARAAYALWGEAEAGRHGNWCSLV